MPSCSAGQHIAMLSLSHNSLNVLPGRQAKRVARRSQSIGERDEIHPAKLGCSWARQANMLRAGQARRQRPMQQVSGLHAASSIGMQGRGAQSPDRAACSTVNPPMQPAE